MNNKKLLKEYVQSVLNEEEQEEDLSRALESSGNDFTWGHLRNLIGKKSSREIKTATLITAAKFFLQSDVVGGLKDIFDSVTKSGKPRAIRKKVRKGLDKKVSPIIRFLNSKTGLGKFFIKAYNINGKGKATPISIDPHVSLLIDDDLEKDFIEYLIESIEDKEKFPDDEPIINFNMTRELQIWLSKNKERTGGANFYKPGRIAPRTKKKGAGSVLDR